MCVGIVGEASGRVADLTQTLVGHCVAQDVTMPLFKVSPRDDNRQFFPGKVPLLVERNQNYHLEWSATDPLLPVAPSSWNARSVAQNGQLSSDRNGGGYVGSGECRDLEVPYLETRSEREK